MTTNQNLYELEDYIYVDSYMVFFNTFLDMLNIILHERELFAAYKASIYTTLSYILSNLVVAPFLAIFLM